MEEPATNYLDQLIPFITLFVSFLIGVFTQKTTHRFEMKRKRYEEFYIPFMQKWIVEFDALVSEEEEKARAGALYRQFILPNAHLMGSKSNKQLLKTSAAYFELIYLEYESTLFEQEFNELVIVILKEAQSLAAKVKYPDLPGAILATLAPQ